MRRAWMLVRRAMIGPNITGPETWLAYRLPMPGSGPYRSVGRIPVYGIPEVTE